LRHEARELALQESARDPDDVSVEDGNGKRGIWASVPPKVRFLILSQILNSFAFGYLLIYATAFLPTNGFTATAVGYIIGFEGITVVLAGIPFAMLSDRRGRKWFIIIGNALFAPTILAFGLTRTLWLYYVAAGVGGLAEAMNLSSWNALIADETDLGNRDAAFSLSFIAGGGAGAVGAALPLAFPALEMATGLSSVAVHTSTLLILGTANFLSPLMFWVLLRNHQEKPHPKERGSLNLGGMGQMLKFSVCNSIIGFGAGLIIPLVTTWLLYKFGVPDTFSGPYFALAGLTIAFAAIASPRVSKRLGLFRAMIATAGSSTLFMFSLAFIPNVYLAGGVYLVRAGLMNMNSPLMDSFLMGITPPQRRGLASTLNAIIWRLPNNGSTIFGGYLLTSARFDVPSLGITHLDLPWVLATMFYVTGIGLLYANFRHVKPNA
jgi:MFS family permease